MFALRDLRSSAKRHPRRATSSDVDLVPSAALNNADRSAAVWARTAPSPIGASACLSLRETYAQPDKHPTRGSGPLDLIGGAHPDVIDGAWHRALRSDGGGHPQRLDELLGRLN